MPDPERLREQALHGSDAGGLFGYAVADSVPEGRYHRVSVAVATALPGARGSNGLRPRGRTVARKGHLSPQQLQVVEYFCVLHGTSFTAHEAANWRPWLMRPSERVAELRAGGFPIESRDPGDVPGRHDENAKEAVYVLSRPLEPGEAADWMGVPQA